MLQVEVKYAVLRVVRPHIYLEILKKWHSHFRPGRSPAIGCYSTLQCSTDQLQ